MIYYIAGMLSIPCKTIVAQELVKIGIAYKKINMGSIELESEVSLTQHCLLKEALHSSGLRLLEDPKEELMQRVKTVVSEMLDRGEALPVNFSRHLSQQLLYDYTYLSNLFSEREGVTLERYIIGCRIEKVKELLHHLNLKEIAHRLHYSSTAHLSAQFKKTTGITPTQFKQRHNSFEGEPVNNVNNYQNSVTA